MAPPECDIQRADDTSEHSQSLFAKASSKRQCYIANHSLPDLEEAIEIYRQALAADEIEDFNREELCCDLASAILLRYQHCWDSKDLDEVIRVYHTVLSTKLSPGSQRPTIVLSRLAAALQMRFEQLYALADMDEAIALHREIVACQSPSHPELSGSLHNLASSVWTKFIYLQESKDLEESTSLFGKALELRPPGHPHRINTMNSLAETYRIRFVLFQHAQDLDSAIAIYNDAIATLPPNNIGAAVLYNNLAEATKTKYDHTGDEADLENVILYHQRCLSLLDATHFKRSNSLNNLAEAFKLRFEQNGQPSELEQSVQLHRESLSLRPIGHPERSISLNNLGGVLKIRFDRHAQITDLNDAIEILREALASRPSGHPDRLLSLNNLADAVQARYELLGETVDINEAIKLQKEALVLAEPSDPLRPTLLNNMGASLKHRYEHSKQISDLDQAIRHEREALDLWPKNHRNRIASIGNLATTIYSRYSAQKTSQMDLSEAKSLYEEVVAAVSPDHPDLLQYQVGLAVISLEQERYDTAFDFFALAVSHGTAGLQDRLTVALNWARQSHGHSHSSTLTAYKTCLLLLNQFLVTTPSLELRYDFLVKCKDSLTSLASNAAAAALSTNDHATAIELLEQGRTLLWSNVQNNRLAIELLRIRVPDLAKRFEELSKKLEDIAFSFKQGLDFEATLSRQRLLSDTLQKLVVDIRGVDGFANFLQATPFATLQCAAAAGPVIIINLSQHRSDAIIVQDRNEPVIINLSSDLLLLCTKEARRLTAARSGDDSHLSRVLLSVLRFLWGTVVEPVTNKLRGLQVIVKSRIWWCPTGVLCTMPLHAAGPYAPRQRNLPDLYISSYTPTLLSLVTARRLTNSHTVAPKLLAVGDDLPCVQEELQVLVDLQSSGISTAVLFKEDATVKNVMDKLQENSWVHFACHGHSKTDAFQGSFQLFQNEPLYLIDLVQARLPHADLAFLSACHTVAGNPDAPDEAIHLAAALQFCGFRSVVGTLWSMDDADGPDVARIFYRELLRRGSSHLDAASALNESLKHFRKQPGISLERWVTFVHIGA